MSGENGRVTTTKRQARVRAPELVGAGGWIGTGGEELTLASLRGKVVLLDFWTFCCVNCLHVLDELRPLEERFRDVLVVVGVHSPKFAHEGDHDAVVAAVERYEVHHPVLDDPELATWSQYAVRAWPTLCVVDPEGYLVHVASGEGHAEGLGRLVEELVAEHEAKGTLRRGDGPYVAPPAATSELLFPGKVLLLPDGDLLVSDTAHHSLVRTAPDGETVLRRYGTGERGLLDGPAPQFAEPQGLCLLDDGSVLVADSVNHALRRLDVETGEVSTVAGTGEQWRPGDPLDGPATQVRLSTPWDVCVHDGEVVVAMAGTHQLWALRDGALSVLAGTTGEGLRDGDATKAYLAQPSGLASDGDRLWFADAETSALRWYARGEVGTAVGTGLFDFGFNDGPAADALFQHPLGVAVLPDGSIAVCDTYNDAVRRYDPTTGEVTTLATGVREPSGAVVVDGDLVVVASAAHRLERPVAPGEMRRVQGQAQRTQRPSQDVGPGEVELAVVFVPPPGQKADDRYGPSTRLVVSASPEGLLLDGAGAGTDLVRRLVLAEGSGTLHVAATAASCDEASDDPQSEHPACHVTQQDWGIPVRVVPGAPARVVLVLNGLDG
ncbi:MAG: alkyl hydroperoxide reductase/Thiol specific antioxidant/Mal allergen [Frankiales bacterium]|nr:alkyl hydroperoxide reductase/Thiol specific antioxidant/Mal allergen [Frankiales bacterium]